MKFNLDKGTAGLTVFLSLVTFIFVVGLLIMIFALMGGELAEATSESGSGSIANETILFTNGTGSQSSQGDSDLRDVELGVCLGLGTC